MGDKIQIESLDEGWLQAVRLITEPVLCDHGACLSCRAVTDDGRKLPVHAAAGRVIRILALGPRTAGGA